MVLAHGGPLWAGPVSFPRGTVTHRASLTCPVEASRLTWDLPSSSPEPATSADPGSWQHSGSWPLAAALPRVSSTVPRGDGSMSSGSGQRGASSLQAFLGQSPRTCAHSCLHAAAAAASGRLPLCPRDSPEEPSSGRFHCGPFGWF